MPASPPWVSQSDTHQPGLERKKFSQGVWAYGKALVGRAKNAHWEQLWRTGSVYWQVWGVGRGPYAPGKVSRDPGASFVWSEQGC